MLFFTEAILLCAVRDAQCKPGNHLKFTRIHTSQYINMKVFFVIMSAVWLYRNNSIWK